MLQTEFEDQMRASPQKSLTRLIETDADVLSAQLQQLRARAFPPEAKRELRRFMAGEAAKLIGISDAYLRTLALDGVIVDAERNSAGRRLYTLEQIGAIRDHLGKNKKDYLRRREEGDHLQVIAVTNFKGGSGKTTTSAHLAQYLALRGYRVLAVDLDPQASLSALFGVQPEFDLNPNETIYGAIRYDDQRCSLAGLIAKTHFAGLDIVPGNLELQEFEHETPRALADGRRSLDRMFFTRVSSALKEVDDSYDIVILDCPPSLGYLTLSALCAATSVLVTIHPQMLDVASMSQFLHMTAGLFDVVEKAGGNAGYDWFRYVLTRYEPNDSSQSQIAGLLKSLFGDRVLTSAMVKSAAISDAGITKQTLYEVGRENFHRQTYDRAMEALDAMNGEIEQLVRQSWSDR